MRRLLFGACLLSLSSGLRASDLEEPDGLLERIQARMREAVKRQPDYTCLQTVDRWVRATPKGSLERMDTLRLEVGLVGNREVFAWKDADRFEERALAAIVNKGTIGNGDFFIHAKNVFLSNTAGYGFKGQYDNGGRKTYIYEYGIPIERSLYRIRVPPHEGIVGYSGTFEVDAVTLDLLRLEVIVDEIPEKLGLAEASAKIAYARVPIGDGDFLLPKASELTMLSVQGEESRNEISFSGCRQFKVESGLVVGDSAPTNPMPPGMTALTLPPRAILDLELSDDLNLESAAIGDRVHTILRHPVREGRRVIVPEGASVSGRLVRVDRSPVPFDHFEVGLELSTLEVGTSRLSLTATLADVKGACVVNEQRRMEPVFTKKRSSRLDILVRETTKGQGVIHCDAKQGRLKKGTEMKWIVEGQLHTHQP